MKKIIYILIFTTLFSCSNDDEKSLDNDLIGIWHGSKTETEYIDSPEHNRTKSMIYAFAYANGVEISADGELLGLVANFNRNEQIYTWAYQDEYVSNWKLADNDKLILNYNTYEILSLTENELILQSENSNIIEKLTLIKQ